MKNDNRAAFTRSAAPKLGRHDYRHLLIIAIYAIMLLYFVGKMLFYSNYVAHFPDEIQHISYVAYLESTGHVIPDFAHMTTLSPENSVDKAADLPSGSYTFSKSGFNYLGHPPLYYQLMRLSRGVTVSGGVVSVHIMQLRLFSMLLATLAMLLIFYLGYSRISKRQPVFHLLYATICVSVPMLAYVSAGVNNDTLSLIAFTVFLLGLIRFAERKRNAGTYFLIAAGVMLSFLAKLTAGMIVITSLLIFLAFLLYRERSAKFMLSWKFLITLPVYLLVPCYLLLVYHQTGSIQPSFQSLDPQGFFASAFYTPPELRPSQTVMQYLFFYAYKFNCSWTGILGHINLTKDWNYFSPNEIGLISLWVLPLFLLIIVRRRKTDVLPLFVVLSTYLGSCVTIVTQFSKSYYEYVHVSGYFGGTQTRYYLCTVSALALAVIFIIRHIYNNPVLPKKLRERLKFDVWKIKRNTIAAFCILFSALLIYEDFIYFLLNYDNYLL